VSGSLELQPRFIHWKPYKFVVSTQQAVALLLFNRLAQYTFEEMQTLTGVPEADLKVALR